MIDGIVIELNLNGWTESAVLVWMKKLLVFLYVEFEIFILISLLYECDVLHLTGWQTGYLIVVKSYDIKGSSFA